MTSRQEAASARITADHAQTSTAKADYGFAIMHAYKSAAGLAESIRMGNMLLPTSTSQIR